MSEKKGERICYVGCFWLDCCFFHMLLDYKYFSIAEDYNKICHILNLLKLANF